MKTLHYSDGTTEDICENLTELLLQQIEWATEDDSFYYIRLQAIGCYDNRIYKVSKNTEHASLIDFIDYHVLDRISDRVTPIDPATIKRKAS